MARRRMKHILTSLVLHNRIRQHNNRLVASLVVASLDHKLPTLRRPRLGRACLVISLPRRNHRRPVGFLETILHSPQVQLLSLADRRSQLRHRHSPQRSRRLSSLTVILCSVVVSSANQPRTQLNPRHRFLVPQPQTRLVQSTMLLSQIHCRHLFLALLATLQASLRHILGDSRWAKAQLHKHQALLPRS